MISLLGVVDLSGVFPPLPCKIITNYFLFSKILMWLS
jgi:hypothetical protein